MLVLTMSIGLIACGEDNSTSSKSEAGDGTIKLKVYAQHFDDDTIKPFDYAVEELKRRCQT